MTTFYIPIEHPGGWFIHIAEHIDPIDATIEAREHWPDKSMIIWAAVRRCPTFDEMRALRLQMDACGYGRSQAKRKKAA